MHHLFQNKKINKNVDILNNRKKRKVVFMNPHSYVSIFKDKIVGIYCSVDVIIPMWANMLIASAIQPFAKAIYFGDENKVREQILLETISKIDAQDYLDQRVVVKGCGETPIGESAYVAITNKLRPVAKSIMYGEPCSTVPVYKKK